MARATRRSLVALLASLPALLAACQTGGPEYPDTGPVAPTVAGGSPATHADYASGRKAFTRRSESEVLTVTLEDAAWLRFEGDPETVAARHKAYFEQGHTTLHVVLRVKEYTRPTEEVYVLEDSVGARIEGGPKSFRGNMTLVDDRWEYTFDLTFPHAITAETRWLRLTRQADGSSVEWQFAGS